ncbi:hypothetical protein [Duganella hordei]|uniref:hypothetical protein n=1 Tax=Duganella hordei TaxID=2865934 RepID=UPI0030E7D77A
MKRHIVADAYNGRPKKPTQQFVQLFTSAMDASAVPIHGLMRLVSLPFRILAGVARFFDNLALACVRGVVTLCFAALALVVLLALVFAFARTIFHPWF